MKELEAIRKISKMKELGAKHVFQPFFPWTQRASESCFYFRKSTDNHLAFLSPVHISSRGQIHAYIKFISPVSETTPLVGASDIGYLQILYADTIPMLIQHQKVSIKRTTRPSLTSSVRRTEKWCFYLGSLGFYLDFRNNLKKILLHS